MENNEILEKISSLETDFDNKIEEVLKYKTAQITLKLITFLILSCLLLVKSAQIKDFTLWIIGTVTILLALAEFIELGEMNSLRKNRKKD